jgi:hypothetical protein
MACRIIAFVVIGGLLPISASNSLKEIDQHHDSIPISSANSSGLSVLLLFALLFVLGIPLIVLLVPIGCKDAIVSSWASRASASATASFSNIVILGSERLT